MAGDKLPNSEINKKSRGVLHPSIRKRRTV